MSSHSSSATPLRYLLLFAISWRTLMLRIFAEEKTRFRCKRTVLLKPADVRRKFLTSLFGRKDVIGWALQPVWLRDYSASDQTFWMSGLGIRSWMGTGKTDWWMMIKLLCQWLGNHPTKTNTRSHRTRTFKLLRGETGVHVEFIAMIEFEALVALRVMKHLFIGRSLYAWTIRIFADLTDLRIWTSEHQNRNTSLAARECCTARKWLLGQLPS